MTGQRPCKIITFYSYKGGTGRSMALANVAWILASTGKRVLAIDWDLEAPGLHRYFHPFIEDKELTATAGLIDFVTEFASAARQTASSDAKWFDPYTDLTRYAFSLDWEFPGEGTVDLVPAGQQGPGYAVKVTSFNWQEFYEKLGGGIWLEAVKSRVRAEYDYVLIDSRTGLSDTSGICTIQMPDELVVCFTLNQQSIRGAAAVAESAWLQRRKPSGEPALKVWPVPMRVELGEKDRLARAREFAREAFDRYTWHLHARRQAYWEETEVLYEPYYAYEEVLAPFAERFKGRATLLRSMETLAGHLTGEHISAPAIPDDERKKGLEAFTRLTPPQPGTRGLIYISYRREDQEFATLLAESLKQHFPSQVFTDQEILPGAVFTEAIDRALEEAAAAIVVIGPGWQTRRPFSDHHLDELGILMNRGIPLIPVIAPKGGFPEKLPPGLESLRNRQAVKGSRREPVHERLLASLRVALGRTPLPPSDPEDPQKGRWGGKPTRNGRILTAHVSELSPDWFDVLLTVEALNGGPPLEGTATFHLHPTFPETVQTVAVKDGRGMLRFGAYGAFTVGAVVDNGRTELELDLAQLDGAPRAFRER